MAKIVSIFLFQFYNRDCIRELIVKKSGVGTIRMTPMMVLKSTTDVIRLRRAILSALDDFICCFMRMI